MGRTGKWRGAGTRERRIRQGTKSKKKRGGAAEAAAEEGTGTRMEKEKEKGREERIKVYRKRAGGNAVSHLRIQMVVRRTKRSEIGRRRREGTGVMRTGERRRARTRERRIRQGTKSKKKRGG